MWPILIGAILLTYVGCDQNKNIIYDDECYPSETTVSGTYAPSCTFCSGSLIFAEEFDEFNLQTWEHIFDPNKEGFYTLVNSRRNSFTEDGVLFLRPSISSDQCATCKTNPVVTAAIRTTKSFSFRYGRVEMRAKLPAGDWLTPALWLLPASSVQYGPWPSSGHISIMHSRGNRILLHNGKNIGIQSANAGLSYGISQQSALIQNQFSRINESGYNRDFHFYQLEWTPGNKYNKP
ncbi:beta-1,3-glucan-binding protein-like [Bicyclus anynana]|uniref:Beta-1,3-glucan-binding protein-like n=1 Tax=Bicyclus anynana TaxID=110368 RepID=A0ABM3LQZ5_BICAN|nr:beta-1,3-glucan-binding protein-like [Bicyclus anynana]